MPPPIWPMPGKPAMPPTSIMLGNLIIMAAICGGAPSPIMGLSRPARAGSPPPLPFCSGCCASPPFLAPPLPPPPPPFLPPLPPPAAFLSPPPTARWHAHRHCHHRRVFVVVVEAWRHCLRLLRAATATGATTANSTLGLLALALAVGVLGLLLLLLLALAIGILGQLLALPLPTAAELQLVELDLQGHARLLAPKPHTVSRPFGSSSGWSPGP